VIVSIGQEVVLRVNRLDLSGAIETAHALWALPQAQVYVIDFAGLDWVEPFGMLFFARQLRTFADKHKPARCRAINHERHGYAAHMGFFQSFGLSFGKAPGEAPGNIQYVPMTGLTIAELQREAGDQFAEVREIIEKRCTNLAAILTRNEGGHVQDTLSYSLREIFRNVMEHSRADTIWYAAQYWPTKQLVELSILDQGIGVRRSLSRNPHLAIQNDEDALRFALLPGISGVAFKGGPRQRKDEWANSGYGLFMTSQLCARGGSFMICSGGCGLLLKNGSDTTFNVGLEGTALRLEIYVPEVGGLNQALEDLRRHGATFAGELRQTANLTASMSSRMLSKDFLR
jgi:hypothetical protein